MRHGRYIYVLGDVHGGFNCLNSFIHREIRRNSTLASIVPLWKRDGDDFQVILLQCGDFAWFWPLGPKPAIQNKIDYLSDGRVNIFWVGGNHEDWDTLDALGPNISELAKGVYYCPFGSILKLAPDITVLFAGGAESSDKTWRLRQMAQGAPKIWWEQEGVSQQDLDRLSFVPKADWVISHTAPEVFDLDSKMRSVKGFTCHANEWSRKMLDEVFWKYHPKRWFFGHFHHHMEGNTDGCQWECLANMDGQGKNWTRLYLEWQD